MGRFRILRKGLLALFLSLCVLLSMGLTASQIEQHIFRRRVERLFSEVQSLELRKTPWQEAQIQFHHWGANRKFDESCDEHKCSFEITLNEFALGYVFRDNNMFVGLDNYIRWRLKLSFGDYEGPFGRSLLFLFRAYMRMGGRPARVIADVGMRDGIVWKKGVWMSIETYQNNTPGVFGGWGGEYELAAEVRSLPRFDYYDPFSLTPRLALHPNYVIGRPGGCEGCVLGWVRFTPYTSPADVHRLMQLNLSCLTRWHPCHEQIDIMPVAWTQYLAENSPGAAISDAGGNARRVECSPSVIETLGRDSANIATGKIMEYHYKTVSQSHRKEVATIHVLGRLKGLEDWKVGETRELGVEVRNGFTNPQIGSGLIFMSGLDRSNYMEINPFDVCPSGIPLNEINLNLVRRGIDQDYSADIPTSKN